MSTSDLPFININQVYLYWYLNEDPHAEKPPEPYTPSSEWVTEYASHLRFPCRIPMNINGELQFDEWYSIFISDITRREAEWVLWFTTREMWDIAFPDGLPEDFVDDYFDDTDPDDTDPGDTNIDESGVLNEKGFKAIMQIDPDLQSAVNCIGVCPKTDIIVLGHSQEPYLNLYKTVITVRQDNDTTIVPFDDWGPNNIDPSRVSNLAYPYHFHHRELLNVPSVVVRKIVVPEEPLSLCRIRIVQGSSSSTPYGTLTMAPGDLPSIEEYETGVGNLTDERDVTRGDLAFGFYNTRCYDHPNRPRYLDSRIDTPSNGQIRVVSDQYENKIPRELGGEGISFSFTNNLKVLQDAKEAHVRWVENYYRLKEAGELTESQLRGSNLDNPGMFNCIYLVPGQTYYVNFFTLDLNSEGRAMMFMETDHNHFLASMFYNEFWQHTLMEEKQRELDEIPLYLETGPYFSWDEDPTGRLPNGYRGGLTPIVDPLG